MSNARLWIAGMALVVGGGCSGGGLGEPTGTQAPPDLAMAPEDLSVPPRDLSRPEDLASAGSHKYVFNGIALPMTRSDYSIDLNGDGHVDNQFGNIVAALISEAFDAQDAVTADVQSGQTIELAAIQTVDPMLVNDPAAVITLFTGRPTATPDFQGMGVYTIDATRPPSLFPGGLEQATFSSANPVTTHTPVSLTLNLPFLGGLPIPLTLHGAHIQFYTGTDAASGAPGLVLGEIQGSIKEHDVQSTIVPAIARILTTQVQANPTSSTARMVEALFDTGMCGSCASGDYCGNGLGCSVGQCTITAQAGDDQIDPCEVGLNNIIENILAPDVQIYDAAGNYAPNPGNSVRDSLSIGLGFTAVEAHF